MAENLFNSSAIPLDNNTVRSMLLIIRQHTLRGSPIFLKYEDFRRRDMETLKNLLLQHGMTVEYQKSNIKVCNRPR